MQTPLAERLRPQKLADYVETYLHYFYGDLRGQVKQL